MPKRKDPIVPTNKRNPANQTRRIQKALKPVNGALDATQAWLLHILESIPAAQVNQVKQPKLGYRYDVSLTRLEQIVAELQGRLGDGGIAVMQGAQAAYQEGTALAAFNLSGLTDDYARTVTQALASEPYIRRSALAGARVMEEMKGFTAETSTDLARVLMIGIQDGRNPLDLARDLRDRFSISKARAERIARTEINAALRRGRLDEAQDTQERLGIKTGMLWASALSPTTRASHARRHGQVYSVDEVRQFYGKDGNSVNCFVPGTQVAGRFVAGSKAHYEGPVVTLVTAGGNILTVTPNHPVMTTFGMIGAAEISIGDDLISYIGETENLAGVGDLNGELMNASIEDVFRSLSDLGHSSRTRVSAVDFHGDASLMDENVEIVYSERVLPVAVNASISKCLDNLAFVKSDPAHFGLGSLGLDFNAVDLPPSGGVGIGCVGAPFLSAREGVAHKLRGASVSPLKAMRLKAGCEAFSGNTMLAAEAQDACARDVLTMDRADIQTDGFVQRVDGAESRRVEVIGNGPFVDANRLGDALDALSGFVARDKVVDVMFSHFSGHVYDLQEVSGLMVAQGVILSNCKCGLSEILLNDDGTPLSSNVVRKMTERREAYEKTPEAKAAQG